MFFEGTYPHKHAVAATPEGLNDLAPRWRRASEGGQAGGIRRFAARRSPRGRLGSVLDVRNCLRRVSGCFRQCTYQYRSSPLCGAIVQVSQVLDPSSLGSPKNRRMRRRRLPDPRPIPEGAREPICPRKKCAIWTRWRPVPVKNVNYPRPPSSRRSGLVGPHTTPAIVNYKYMTSTS